MSTKDTIQGNDWVEKLLVLYSEGRSDLEVCRDLNITVKQFDEYMHTSPAFKDLVDRGRDYSQAWWYAQGRKNLENKNFMTELYKFGAMNRFGWTTKSESKRDGAMENVNIDKLKEELKTKMPELALLLGEPIKQREMISESGNKKH